MSIYPSNIARCQHIKINGTQCGSPALRRDRFCYFHKNWESQRLRIAFAGAKQARRSSQAVLDLPLLEDANSVQIALMQVMRLLVSGSIEHRTAALLLYGLQTASANLRHTRFEPYVRDVVIDPSHVAGTLVDGYAWDPEQLAAELEEDAEDMEKVKARIRKLVVSRADEMLPVPSRENSPIHAEAVGE